MLERRPLFRRDGLRAVSGMLGQAEGRQFDWTIRTRHPMHSGVRFKAHAVGNGHAGRIQRNGPVACASHDLNGLQRGRRRSGAAGPGVLREWPAPARQTRHRAPFRSSRLYAAAPPSVWRIAITV